MIHVFQEQAKSVSMYSHIAKWSMLNDSDSVWYEYRPQLEHDAGRYIFCQGKNEWT